jgi:hypothetical protein
MPDTPIDHLQSDTGEVHVINATVDGPTLEAGILCVISFSETTIRISNEQHSFLIELPEDVRAKGERLKAFNVPLAILDYEQVQLPAGI